MNLKQLQYFLAVAEEGQMTAAAKRLHVAQPPLSYQIKQLELELGVTLFNRLPQGVTVTEAGKLLVGLPNSSRSCRRLRRTRPGPWHTA